MFVVSNLRNSFWNIACFPLSRRNVDAYWMCYWVIFHSLLGQWKGLGKNRNLFKFKFYLIQPGCTPQITSRRGVFVHFDESWFSFNGIKIMSESASWNRFGLTQISAVQQMQRGTPKVKCSQLLLPELFWHISKVVNGPFFYGLVIFWGKPSLSFLCLFFSLFWKHGVTLSFQLSMFCSSFSRLVTSCENDDIWTSLRLRKSNYTKPFSCNSIPKKVILERLLSLSMSTESIGAKIAFVRRVSDPEKCRRDHPSPDPWREQIWKAIQCIFENPPIGFAKLFSSPPKRKRMGAELICNIVSVGFSIFFS